ncbi:MAG: tetratricopeptide repeat protein [Candidatus Sulfotelmatobacter sp.]
MHRWLYFCLLLGFSGGLAAQQAPAQPGSSQAQAPSSAPAASTPSKPSTPPNQPAAGDLSHDLSFPEDDPKAATPSAPAPKGPNLAPPRSDTVQADDLGAGVGESSSKDTQIDLSPPADDDKRHPQSSAAVASDLAPGGITELQSWDPHKAAKDVEVGDFYFKRKNYRAAEDRYREALRYKDNDAVATIRLAVCLEKLGILDGARAEYESYLKILPHGPEAPEAQRAIERLKAQNAGQPQ